MCGVFGAVLPAGEPNEAANLAALGLFALQHRGQESAGLAVSDVADAIFLPRPHTGGDNTHATFVLARQGLEHTPALDELKPVELEFHVPRQGVVVREPPQFGVVGKDDLGIATAKEGVPVTGLQNSHIPVTLLRGELEHLLPRHVELHHLRRRPAGEVLRATLAPHCPLATRVGSHLVTEKGGAIARLADTALLLGHAKGQRVGQETLNLGEDLSRIFLATNHADEKIIGVTAVAKSAIPGVHAVSRR